MLRFIIVASMLMFQATAARLLSAPEILLGADRDEFGCIGSAGYSWCNYTQSCQSANEICMPSLSSN